MRDRWVPIERSFVVADAISSELHRNRAFEVLRAAAVEGVVVPRKALEIARQELQWAYNDLRNNYDSAIREGDALKAIDAALSRDVY